MVRLLREDIDARVRQLLSELVEGDAASSS